MQANLAALKEAEYSNLKVRPVVGRKHSVAWAVSGSRPASCSARSLAVSPAGSGTVRCGTTSSNAPPYGGNSGNSRLSSTVSRRKNEAGSGER